MALHPPINPFRPYNVQKVLPAVYDDSLSYYELLCKMQSQVNDVTEGYNSLYDAMVLLQLAWQEFEQGGYLDGFEEFVADWFEENQDKIDQFLEDGFAGELAQLDDKIDTTADDIRSSIADDYVPFPTSGSKYGTTGQVLSTNSEGGTSWADPVTVTSEVAEPLIRDWLNEHPEATTTVEDGSITNVKIADSTIKDEKLVPYGVRFTSDYALGVVRSICDVSQGTIDKSMNVDVNEVYGGEGYFINWETGKVQHSGNTTGIVAIPCQPSSAYTVSSSSVRSRLAIGCCSQLPPVNDQLDVFDGGADRESVTITTDENAHWLMIFFYTSYTDTDTVTQAYSTLTITGARYVVSDDVAREALEDVHEVEGIVSLISGTFYTSISLDDAISINTLYEVTGISINWLTGKIVNNEGIYTETIVIPCMPDSTYVFDTSISLYRFVAGYCDTFPVIGTVIDGVSGSPSLSSITLNTGANTKYIVLWYWDDRGTLTKAESYAAISAHGPSYTAIDRVAREQLTNGEAIGQLELTPVDNEWWINTNGAIGISSTSGVAYVDVSEFEHVGISTDAHEHSRFKIGFSSLLPQVGTVLTNVVDLSEEGGAWLEVPTGANYLCAFYYTESSYTITKAEAFSALRFFGRVSSSIDTYARNRFAESAMQVVVDKNGDIDTITKGCALVADGGTVIVMQGTYEEQVSCKNKTVHIVGIDKYSCILLDNSGMYATPPLEISSGSVSNMTIIETSRDSTPQSEGSNPTLAYCIHCDFDYEMNKQLDIDNCILIANKRCVIGCGVRSGWTLNVTNCYMWSGVQAKREAIRGCFFVHTGLPLTADPIANAKVRLVHNEINCDDELAICFRDLISSGYTVPFEVEAIGNMVYSSVTGKTSKSIWGTVDNNVVHAADAPDFAWSSGVIRDARSFGNNVEVLNA